MRRPLISLVMFFMLLMGVMVSSAHAGELSICVDEPVAAEMGHMTGDSDEVPADAGKGYPHHHAACHCHQQADVDGYTLGTFVALVGDEPLVTHRSFTRLVVHETTLRPPIA